MPKRPMPITGSVLAWAIERSGLSREEVADAVGVDVQELDGWLREEAQPSKGQLTALARALHRPSAVFFLPTPPRQEVLTTALRRARGRVSRDLNREELRAVRRARRLQRLASWVLRDLGEPPVRLPAASPGSDPAEAARRLRGWVGLSVAEQLAFEKPGESFGRWREALADRGVLVLQLALGWDGLRGFSSHDEYAPLVAVNTADNYQARTFTLFHEVAHLSSGTEQACTGPPALSANGSLERWCEEVAASTLLPKDEVRRVANDLRTAPSTPADDFEFVRLVADRFKVSLRAAAIRLVRLGLTAADVYEQIEEHAPILEREKGFGRGGAGSAPVRRARELGTRAGEVLLKAFEYGRVTERDLRDYLRLDGPEIADFREEIVASAG